ncbi:MAG: serine/threonine protein kinase [Pirellulales bacterium]|nr:serine/threonine protein kinase [Pirellulales bacterium]
MSVLEQVVLEIEERGAAVELHVVQGVLDCCRHLDTHGVIEHFRRVRDPRRYLSDFSARQIADHVSSLAQLSDSRLVRAEVQRAPNDAEVDILVAGVDLVGVSACISIALASLGLMIRQLDVVTYDSEGDSSTKVGSPPQFEVENKFVMVFRASGGDPRCSAQKLCDDLNTRLHAAYFHLVRGDLPKAHQQALGQDELVGTKLEGRFELLRPLADGGMGVVYLARQLDLDRLVAVKLLREECAARDGFLESFQREARLLAQAQHISQLVHVYAAGVTDDRCWIALEYLPGGDLSNWVERYGTPSLGQACRWLRDALEALRRIHEDLGMIHCDIKPHNLLLDARQNLKVGDLGLSQLWRLAYVLGPDGRVRGTPMYMAPEQARGELLDARSDLFSLGATFFYLLSGEVPYEASSPAELMAKVANGHTRRLADRAPDLQPPLGPIVERLMQPDPRARYQSAAVALADLESYRAAWEAAPLSPATLSPARKVRVVRDQSPAGASPREVARGVRTDARHGSTAMP